MPLAEANSLIDHTHRPARYVQAHDPAADRQALQDLAIWCERFSPIVGLDQFDPPEGLLLDVTGIDHLFGGESALASCVLEAFHEQGYRAQVAIAETIGAAWAFARFAAGPSFQPAIEFDRLPADCQTCPTTPVIVPHTETALRINLLPVAALRLEEESIRILHQLGVERIEQLAALPREAIAVRLGDDVLGRIDQALGQCPEVMVPCRAAPRFEAKHVLEQSTDRRETIEQILCHLTNDLIEMLALHNQGALQVRYQFACQDCSLLSLLVGLFRPTVNATHLLNLVRLQLDSRAIPADVVSISVQALVTARLPCVQRRLLDEATRDDPQELAMLIDRLSSRLGTNTVLATRLRTNALPEYAYTTIPLTGDMVSRARLHAASGRQGTRGPMERPLRLLNPPLRLAVISISPHGSPASFFYGNRQHIVHRHWGPERIETAWWRGSTVRRDYFRVETKAGAYFWLFRRLDDRSWFLHGE
jgi:protein ImuB